MVAMLCTSHLVPLFLYLYLDIVSANSYNRGSRISDVTLHNIDNNNVINFSPVDTDLWLSENSLLSVIFTRFNGFSSIFQFFESFLQTWFGCILLLGSMVTIAFVALLLWVKPSYVPLTVPGPPRIAGIGFLKYVLDRWETWPTEVVRLSHEYNCTWGGPMPNLGGLGGACFFLVDESSVRHVLRDSFDAYEKGDAFRHWLSDLLGDGIFAADGETWKAHRKTASHFFSRNWLRHSADVTKSKLDEVVHMLNEQLLEAEESAKTESVTIDIQDVFFRMTVDIVSSTSFGVELNSIRRGQQHPFALAFDEVQTLAHPRVIDPFFRIKRFFSLTRNERRIKKAIKLMRQFTDSVITSRKYATPIGYSREKPGMDLISRYLQNAKINGEELPTNKQLHDVVMNLIIAGRDTTACALSWTFYELTRHPEIVNAVVKEVRSVCGIGADADFSYETMARLTYTHAVVMEALRLHPSVPGDCKYAIKDDFLPDGTFIPRGSMVNYYPLYFGRSEEIWGPDVLQFKPERFLYSKEPSPFLLPIFNAGYRTCLGKPLALMNMKMTLARLLPEFNFVDEVKHSGQYKWTLVRSMKGGFPVALSKRVDSLDQ